MQRNYSQEKHREKLINQIKKCTGQTTNQPNKKFTDATQLFTGKPQEKNQPTK